MVTVCCESHVPGAKTVGGFLKYHVLLFVCMRGGRLSGLHFFFFFSFAPLRASRDSPIFLSSASEAISFFVTPLCKGVFGMMELWCGKCC